jgi:hypothetical protein
MGVMREVRKIRVMRVMGDQDLYAFALLTFPILLTA